MTKKKKSSSSSDDSMSSTTPTPARHMRKGKKLTMINNNNNTEEDSEYPAFPNRNIVSETIHSPIIPIIARPELNKNIEVNNAPTTTVTETRRTPMEALVHSLTATGSKLNIIGGPRKPLRISTVQIPRNGRSKPALQKSPRQRFKKTKGAKGHHGDTWKPETQQMSDTYLIYNAGAGDEQFARKAAVYRDTHDQPPQSAGGSQDETTNESTEDIGVNQDTKTNTKDFYENPSTVGREYSIPKQLSTKQSALSKLRSDIRQGGLRSKNRTTKSSPPSPKSILKRPSSADGPNSDRSQRSHNTDTSYEPMLVTFVQQSIRYRRRMFSGMAVCAVTFVVSFSMAIYQYTR